VLGLPPIESRKHVAKQLIGRPVAEKSASKTSVRWSIMHCWISAPGNRLGLTFRQPATGDVTILVADMETALIGRKSSLLASTI